jgi:hypothetical protein
MSRKPILHPVYPNLTTFTMKTNNGCSFKFIIKVSIEESIVKAPLAGLQNKNTNSSKSELRFKQLIRDL